MFYFVRRLSHFLMLCSANLFSFLIDLFSMSSSEEGLLSDKSADGQSDSATDRSVSECDSCDEGDDKSDGEQKSIATSRKSSINENTSDWKTEDEATDDSSILDDLLNDMDIKYKELAEEDSTLSDYIDEDDLKVDYGLDLSEFEVDTSAEDYTSFSVESSTSSQSSQSPRSADTSDGSFYSDGSNLWAMHSSVARASSVTSLSCSTEYEFEVTAFTEDEDDDANELDNDKLSETLQADGAEVVAKLSASLKQAIEQSMKSVEIDFTTDLGILGAVDQDLKKDDEGILAQPVLDANKMFGTDHSTRVSPANDSAVWPFQDENYSLQDFDTGAEEKREEDPDLYDHKEAGHEFPEDVKPLKPRMPLSPMPPMCPSQFYPTGGLMYPPAANSSPYSGANCTWTSQVPPSGVTPFYPPVGQSDSTRVQLDSRSSQYYPPSGHNNTVKYSGERVSVSVTVTGCTQYGPYRNNSGTYGNRGNYGGNQYSLRPNNAYQNRANMDGSRSYDRASQQPQDHSRQFNSNQGQRTGNYTTASNTNKQTFSHEGFNPNRAASTYDARPQDSSTANQWMANESIGGTTLKDDLLNNSNRPEPLNVDLIDTSGTKLVAREQQDWYDFEDLSTPSFRSSSTNDQRSTGYRSYGVRENVQTENYFARDGYGGRGGGGGARYDNQSRFTGQRPTRYQEQQLVEPSQVSPSIASTSGNGPTWSSIVSNRH